MKKNKKYWKRREEKILAQAEAAIKLSERALDIVKERDACIAMLQGPKAIDPYEMSYFQ